MENTLESYLRDKDLTKTDLANGIGFSLPVLTRAMNGDNKPGDELGYAIQEYTEGEVSAAQFEADCHAARQARRGAA